MNVLLGSRQTFSVLALLVLSIANIGICEEPTITVSGDAEIRVVPDHVIITAGVVSRAKSVTAAAKDNDIKIAAILEFLESSGIEDKNIRTEYISIEPIMKDSYEGKQGQSNANGNQVNRSQNDDPFGEDTAELSEQPIGYQATRQFAITVTKLASFEEIYKGLIEQGINRVQGIEFRTSQLRQHRDQARLNAVRAAREKAQAMSGELGARLASVQTIRETRNSEYGYTRQNSIDDPFAESGDEGTLAAGQIAITASVEVVFVLGKTGLEE